MMVSVASDWSRVELVAIGIAITIGQILDVWNGAPPDTPDTPSVVAAVVVGVVAALCTLYVIDRFGRFWVAVAVGAFVLAVSFTLLERRTSMEFLDLVHHIGVFIFTWTTISGLFPAADLQPSNDGSPS